MRAAWVVNILLIVAVTFTYAYNNGNKVNKDIKLLKQFLESERRNYNKGRIAKIDKTVNDIIRQKVNIMEDILGYDNDEQSNKKNKEGRFLNSKAKKAKPYSSKTDTYKYRKLKRQIARAPDYKPLSEEIKTSIITMLNYLVALERRHPKKLRTELEHTNKLELDEISLNDDDDGEIKILDKISNFYHEVTEDIKIFARNHRRKCQQFAYKKLGRTEINNSSDTSSSDKQSSLEINETINQTKNKMNLCNKYKICPNLLVSFLTDFYQMLNETVVNTLRNYGAMYSKDLVSEGSNEQQTLNNVINNVIFKGQSQILDAFENSTNGLLQNIKEKDWSKFTKLQVNNMFDEYISNTIAKVTTVCQKDVVEEFQSTSIKSPKQEIVQNDLTVNIKLEFGNLGSTMYEKLCHVFNLCEVMRRKVFVKNNNLNNSIRKADILFKTSKSVNLQENHEFPPTLYTNKLKTGNPNVMTTYPIKQTRTRDFEVKHHVVTRTSYADKATEKYAVHMDINKNEIVGSYILSEGNTNNTFLNENRTVSIMSIVKDNEIN